MVRIILVYGLFITTNSVHKIIFIDEFFNAKEVEVMMFSCLSLFRAENV